MPYHQLCWCVRFAILRSIFSCNIRARRPAKKDTIRVLCGGIAVWSTLSNSNRTCYHILAPIMRRWCSSSSASIKAQTLKMRERLQAQPQDWESLWQEGVTPWDLGRPTVALASELVDFRPARSTLRSLVPGCGAGYDLITVARHHDALLEAKVVDSAAVIGLDLSPTSLQRATAVLQQEFETFPVQTDVQLIQGDYFVNPQAWKLHQRFGKAVETDQGENGIQFDLLFDYTFFCALPLALREAWGRTTAELLHDDGRLLTFMFPVVDAPKDQGPPYPVTLDDYRRVLEPLGWQLESEPHVSADTDPQRVGKELIGWWKHE